MTNERNPYDGESWIYDYYRKRWVRERELSVWAREEHRIICREGVPRSEWVTLFQEGQRDTEKAERVGEGSEMR